MIHIRGIFFSKRSNGGQRVLAASAFLVCILAAGLFFGSREASAQTVLSGNAAKPRLGLTLPPVVYDNNPSVSTLAGGAGVHPVQAKDKDNSHVRSCFNPGGSLRYLDAPRGAYFPVTNQTGAPEGAARAFFGERKNLLAIHSAAVNFTLKKQSAQDAGANLRFAQTYAGIPVYTGETIVETRAGKGVTSVLSRILTRTDGLDKGTPALEPGISAAAAIEAAEAFVHALHLGTRLQSTAPTLMIYEPELLGEKGPVRLVWQTIVSPTVSGAPFRQFVLVDAHTGEIAFTYNQVHDALNRQIYDANNTSTPTLARVEGDPATGIADVDKAYTFFGDVYNFYKTVHNRDSIDDHGMPMIAAVRYVPVGESFPYENAYWDPNVNQMFFGSNFVVEDVTAHELTHGVTQFTSNLVYANESGAISEHFSDAWGEWVDQTQTSGTSRVDLAKRWYVGHDLPLVVLGGYPGLRYMKDPTAIPGQYGPHIGDFGPQPDRYDSPYYDRVYNEVHHNSGVGNKLAYLVTDGGTFNGHTIQGLGVYTAAQVWYQAQTRSLTSNAQYKDLARGLRIGAENLGLSLNAVDNIRQAANAVAIVNLTTYTLTDYYDIVYKDKDNPAATVTIIAEQVEQDYSGPVGKIQVLEPTGLGTLKITKKSNMVVYPDIAEVSTEGSFIRVEFDANIRTISAKGKIGAVVSKNGYAQNVTASQIGTVDFTAYASSHTQGELFITNIEAGVTTGSWGQNAIDKNLQKMKVSLKGVCLGDLWAPAQEATVNLETKKWVSLDAGPDLSFAYIVPTSVTLADGSKRPGEIRVGDLKGLTLNTGDIKTRRLFSTVRTKTNVKISAQGQLFTFPNTRRFFYGGDLQTDDILCNAANLTITLKTGDLRANRIFAVSQIANLTAKAIPLPWRDEAPYDEFIAHKGGLIISNIIQTGMFSNLDTTQTPEPRSFGGASPDIKSISADWGLNWNWRLADPSVPGNYVADLFTDYIVSAGNGDGRILKITTAKPKDTGQIYQLSLLGGPFICGKGYSSVQGKITNGNWRFTFFWN